MIAAVVFLGGWNTPLPNLIALEPGQAAEMGTWELFKNLQFAHLTTGSSALGMALWGAVWVLAKGFGAVFVQMWIRWTLPRVRVDQLLRLGWKVLTPAAFVLLLISGIWKLAEVYCHP